MQNDELRRAQVEIRKEYVRYKDLPPETAGGRHIAVEFISCVYSSFSVKPV